MEVKNLNIIIVRFNHIYMRWEAVLAVLAFKLLVSLGISLTTEFVPDEHWQSTEVAYTLHFGHGHLTWEWYANIRSYIPPVVILSLYKIGSLLNCDGNSIILLWLPKILQSLLTLVGWHYFHKFATEVMSKAGNVAGGLLLISWFTSFCGARLISNQTEMSLNCIALYWLVTDKLVPFSFIMGLNFAMRPTAAIFWLPFLPSFFPVKTKTVKYFLKCLIFAALPLGAALALDSQMSGSLSPTWLEFFKFNFLQGGSAEFGIHSPAWYFYSGLPSILGPFVVLLPLGYFARETRPLTNALTFYLILYSFIPHKEIRFLLPAAPLVFTICGSVINSVLYEKKNNTSRMAWFLDKCLKTGIVLFIALNLGATIFLGFYHQRGVKPATTFISQQISEMDKPRVWLLAPCYSVPVHSHIHHPNVELQYYICAPQQFRQLYKDGAFIQPNGFSTVDLEADITNKLTTAEPPHFILAFGEYVPKILKAFEKNDLSYHICQSYAHTDVGDFARTVEVLCKS
ncbi:GPI mannosyltransferase 3 [Orchesella cincta]|uniref:Mannosyltransferase n=1 Tax=Orchesella cincta TaxID=48709 RepID=A0A1D2M610_ORCCI|nr:GPI mannosyltransferase 3 [Orchesella cincta]